MHTPYTYLIGWSSLDLWYYGVRTKKGCSPEDFWVEYFTSSKRVKAIRQEHGDPDIIEIRKKFKTSKEALNWELKVLRRLKVRKKFKWLNLCDNAFGAKENWNLGLTKENNEHIKRVSQKISMALKGRASNLKGHKYEESKVEANRWRQILKHNPNIGFVSYKEFKTDLLKTYAQGAISYKKLSILYGVGYKTIHTTIGTPSNSSWVKIVNCNPDFRFDNYDEFSKYCYLKNSDGFSVNEIFKELNVSYSAIRKSINYWKSKTDSNLPSICS